MEKQCPWEKDISKIEKTTDESETGFNFIKKGTVSTHFMFYDAGKYVNKINDCFGTAMRTTA